MSIQSKVEEIVRARQETTSFLTPEEKRTLDSGSRAASFLYHFSIKPLVEALQAAGRSMEGWDPVIRNAIDFQLGEVFRQQARLDKVFKDLGVPYYGPKAVTGQPNLTIEVFTFLVGALEMKMRAELGEATNAAQAAIALSE